MTRLSSITRYIFIKLGGGIIKACDRGGKGCEEDK